MDNKVLIGVACILMLLTSAAAGTQGATPTADDALKIVSLTTDEDVYSAQEDVNISLSLYTPENLSTVLITIKGVKSKKGVYYVSISKKTNLIAGENTISFTKRLPSCSQCAGIDLGPYYINASVAHGDDVVTASHSIVLSNPDTPAYVNVSASEAKRRLETEDFAILDLRTEEEYDAGHIEYARVIPLSEFHNRTGELNKSKKILVYSEYGTNSTIASNILIAASFDKVYNMRGGITAWNDSGYTLVPSTTPIPEIPGFSAVLAFAGLLIIACWRRRHDGKNDNHSFMIVLRRRDI